jgi:hypothetical protein
MGATNDPVKKLRIKLTERKQDAPSFRQLPNYQQTARLREGREDEMLRIGEGARRLTARAENPARSTRANSVSSVHGRQHCGHAAGLPPPAVHPTPDDMAGAQRLTLGQMLIACST